MSTAWVHRDFRRPLVGCGVLAPLPIALSEHPEAILHISSATPVPFDQSIKVYSGDIQNKQCKVFLKRSKIWLGPPALHGCVWSKSFKSLIFKILNNVIIESLFHRPKRQFRVEVLCFL